MPLRLRYCLAVWWLPAAAAFAQGEIILNNRVANVVVAPIYALNPADPTGPRTGNTEAGFPAGMQVYSSPPVSGEGYTAQLFGGPVGAGIEDLVPLFPTTLFRSGEASGFIVAPTMAVKVPGVPEGARARIQLRVWDNRQGTVTNWGTVMADPSVPRGSSLALVSPPLGGIFMPPPNLAGLQSFSLAVPIFPVHLLPLVRAQVIRPGGRVQFMGQLGVKYSVEWCERLDTPWQVIGLATNVTGTFFEYVDLETPFLESGIYRVLATRP